jgi:protein PhnA
LENFSIFAAYTEEMNIEEKLRERSGSACELCESKENLKVYEVPPVINKVDQSILICQMCHEQINDSRKVDANHWRCLNGSMWSTIPAVQVVAWRMLNLLKHEGWPQDLLDMLYLDDETLAWAKATAAEVDVAQVAIHKDSNGTQLQNGDTITLIKDLDVKGGGFTAKRGTTVKGISLVENNAGHIEGKINGQQIVILTQFVRKASS